MLLKDISVRNAKPKEKAYKLNDGGGLHLLVRPNGARLWQMRYRFFGKENTLSFGAYPEVPLSAAREQRDHARRLLLDGQDPAHVKKLEQVKAATAAATTFEAVAEEWLDKRRREGKAESTMTKDEWLLCDLTFPHIGKRPIGSITPPELLDVLRKAERRGRYNSAIRQRSVCGQVFRYAIATGRAERDPTHDLRGALTIVRAKHHAALLLPDQIAPLLRDIHAYKGRGVTIFALKLAPLVFLRPIELRSGEWTEIQEDDTLWRIPAGKLKMRREHLVPLPTQARDIIRNLRAITGHGRYMFPSMMGPKEPMSENTVNAALRRLGYEKDEMTGHGFRRMASTRLNEMGFNKDWIERQLAHADEDEIRQIYNAAEWLPQRRQMLQAWADYLDGLRIGKSSG